MSPRAPVSLPLPGAIKEPATSCCALWKFEGPWMNFPRKGVDIPREISLYLHCSRAPWISPPSENAGPGRSPRMGTTQTEGSWGHFFPVLSFIFCSFLCPPNLQLIGAGGQRSVCSDPATSQAASLETVQSQRASVLVGVSAPGIA